MNKIVINKNRKRIILGSVIALLVGLVTWLTLYAQALVERELSNYLSSSSNEQYTIDLGQVDVNIFNKNITISDFKVDCSPMLGESYYRIQADELKVTQLDLKKLLQYRKLHLGLLSLTKPQISIYSSEKREQEVDTTQRMVNPEELLLQLKPFLSSTLHEIQVDEFSLKQATILHYESERPDELLNAIKRLNISIDNFWVNEELIANQQLFSSDEVTLQMSDFDYALSDGIHHMHLGRFTYLLHDDSFYGENLSIMPIDSTRKDKPLYFIELPYLGVKTDISSLTQVNAIRIDSLLALDANIRYLPVNQHEEFDVNELSQIDLYQLIKDDLTQLSIGYVRLEAQKLVIESPDTTTSPQVFQKMQFQAHQFVLDSLSAANSEKFLCTDNFKFTVGKYSHLLKNKAQLLEANQVQLNTYERYIKAENISLVQLDTLQMSTNYSFECDSLWLNEISLPKLLHQHILPLQKLAIYGAQIEVEQWRERETKKKERDFQEQIFNLVNNYVEGLYAETILIENSRVELFDNRGNSSGYIGTDFRFELNNFELDAQSAKQSTRMFNVHSFDILLSDYSMDMNDKIHQLDLDTIHISSQDESLSIINAHLHPRQLNQLEQTLQRQKKHQLFDITLPEVSLIRTNLLETFFYQRLVIDRFEIANPDIQVAVYGASKTKKKKRARQLDFKDFYQLIQEHVTHVEVRELTFQHARLSYINHQKNGTSVDFKNQFSLKLEHFLFNEQAAKQTNKLPAQAFQFTIENPTFHLPDEVHSIYADEVSFSSRDSSLRATNIKLYADPRSEKYYDIPWFYNIDIPSIYMDGMNLEALSFNKIITLNHLVWKNAQINLYENFKQKKQRRKTPRVHSPLHFKMPEGINLISIGSLMFEHSELSIFSRQQGKYEKVLNSKIDFQFADISVTKNSLQRASFHVNNYQFTSSDFNHKSLRSNWTTAYQQLQLSSANKTLELTNLACSTLDSNGELQQFLFVPRMHLSDIDPRDLIDHKQFICSKLEVEDPIIKLGNLPQSNVPKKRKSNHPFYWQIPHQLANTVGRLKVGELNIHQAQLYFSPDVPLQKLTQVDVCLNRVDVDTTLSVKAFGANDFKLNVPNLHFSNELYSCDLAQFSFSSAEQLLSLQGVELTPLLDPESYQSYFDFQNEYFYVRLPELKVQDIDEDLLFKHKRIQAEKLEIDNLGLFAFRDKRLPFNEANNPPMPQEAIRKIPIAFHVDTLQLQDANFAYSERLDITPESYKVTFNETNVLLYPFSNQFSPSRPMMNLDVQSKLQGVSDLNAKMSFDMLSDSCNYSVSAVLKPLELTSISSITDNAALVAIKSGTLNQLLIDFDADKYHSSGSLVLDYEDLSITALKYKKEKLKPRRFLSFLANMVVPSQKKQTQKQEESEIYFERDDTKSIFSYWWKSVFSGLKDAFGVESEEKQ
ncbi:MAG: hypothetical protein ACK5JS_06930 [Mangrovibacterium sp.]